MQQIQEPHDQPRKPKSGFAREKVKRLAAEARAAKAETKLRELEHAMGDVEQIQIEEPEEQSARSDRPRSGYARLRNRHRDLIELYEALTAKHEELQLDVQRLLEQHTRLMQAVRSGPNWAEMANDTLAQLAAHPNPAALQGTAAALAQLQNHLAAIVARAGGSP